MREFNHRTNLGYDKKTLQNKWNDLKRGYYLFKEGNSKSRLGRDPKTGDVTAPANWLEDIPAECSTPAKPTKKIKRPRHYDELDNILAHIPRDRGELLSAGGPQHTPPSLHNDPYGRLSFGQSSKRSIGEHSVHSPRKKSTRTPSLDDSLVEVNAVIKSMKKRQGEEDSQFGAGLQDVREVLRADVYEEHDEIWNQAVNLCHDKHRRHVFLSTKTKKGREAWVKVTWQFMQFPAK